MSQEPTIWSYAPLSGYAVPGEPTTAALGRLRRLWKATTAALRRSKNEETAPEERDRPSSEALAAMLPVFDVEAAAGALAEALGDWPAGDGVGERTRVVVGPPGAGTREVVETLARRQGWVEISPPTRAGLLEPTDAVQAGPAGLAAKSGRPAAIAELHRWLLRSERGLPHMRRLLAGLRDPAAPTLVSCDSWAWSFLDATLGVRDLLGEPLALAPLGAPALAAWLGRPFRDGGLVCRPMEKPGSAVFGGGAAGGAGGEASGQEPGAEAVSSVLVRLASAARGNPGPALELWQRSLRLARRQPGSGPDPHDQGAATVWSAPLERSEIGVPSRLESAHRLVLHALLLHGGLELELLPAVLPLPRHEILRRLRDLGREGLVAEQGGEASIPVAAYVAVRDYLDSEGFLVDGF